MRHLRWCLRALVPAWHAARVISRRARWASVLTAGRVDSVRILLAGGARTSPRNSQGDNALDLAKARRGEADAAQSASMIRVRRPSPVRCRGLYVRTNARS